MPDNDSLRPAGTADLDTPPADAGFRPADPLKDTGVDFEPAADTSGRASDIKQAVRDNGAKLQTQAADRARALVDQGKTAATEKLADLSRLLDDAARQVDDKLGEQYGQYARDAAARVNGFADGLAAKDADELVDAVRGFVRQSPGAALGIAAAVGFAVARVVQSGLDDRA